MCLAEPSLHRRPMSPCAQLCFLIFLSWSCYAAEMLKKPGCQSPSHTLSSRNPNKGTTLLLRGRVLGTRVGQEASRVGVAIISEEPCGASGAMGSERLMNLPLKATQMVRV